MTAVDRAALLPVILDATPYDWEVVLVAGSLGETLSPAVRAAAQELLDSLNDEDAGQVPYLRTLVLASDEEFAGLAEAAQRARDAREGGT